METLEGTSYSERQRSFDPLASVKLLQYDLEQFGYVLPHTLARVKDEQLSYLAEGIDRASRTVFELRRQEGELVYFNNGRWSPYLDMVRNGAEVARVGALQDPRRNFLYEWAQNDVYHAAAMHHLRPGEQHVWCSPYPYDEELRSGAAFLEECGLQPARKMGLLYRAYGAADGSVVLESQTVDRSDDEAFEMALEVAKYNPAADLDIILAAYDAVLSQKQGGYFYAGRRNAELCENAWDTISTQWDLIRYLLNELEAIAGHKYSQPAAEKLTKRLLYGVWAAFKRRIEGEMVVPVKPAGNFAPAYYALVAQEVHGAFREFAAAGKVLSGCGGAIRMLQGENELLNASVDDVFKAVFSDSSTSKETSYKFDKWMFCAACQAPPSETEVKNSAKKMCGPCGICRSCDKKLRAKSVPKSQSEFALAA